MPVAQFPINWLQALGWADKSRVTGLSHTYLSIPVIAAGANALRVFAPPGDAYGAIVYDVRPTLNVVPNVLSWQVNLGGDLVADGPIGAETITNGLQNLLLITQHESLRLTVFNNGLVANLFECNLHFIKVVREEDMELVRAQLASLANTGRIETLLDEISINMNRMANLMDKNKETDLSEPAPPFSPSVIEALRRQA